MSSSFTFSHFSITAAQISSACSSIYTSPLLCNPRAGISAPATPNQSLTICSLLLICFQHVSVPDRCGHCFLSPVVVSCASRIIISRAAAGRRAGKFKLNIPSLSPAFLRARNIRLARESIINNYYNNASSSRTDLQHIY